MSNDSPVLKRVRAIRADSKHIALPEYDQAKLDSIMSFIMEWGYTVTEILSGTTYAPYTHIIETRLPSMEGDIVARYFAYFDE